MVETVIRASNILGIDERRLFNLSYRYWYARSEDADYIRAVFIQYLNENIAPYWVVYFARRVLQAYQSGFLDPMKFGIRQEYEILPLTWSLIFKTPGIIPVNDADGVFVA